MSMMSNVNNVKVQGGNSFEEKSSKGGKIQIGGKNVGVNAANRAQNININDINFGRDNPDLDISRQDLGLGANERPQERVNVLNVNQAKQDVANEASDEDKNFVPASMGFDFKALKKISDGRHNVGELVINGDGSLGKINNHVGFFSYKNTVRTTPEQNLDVRRRVYYCLKMEYQGKPGSQALLERACRLLLNKGDRESSLSRDEVNFLVGMLKNEKGLSWKYSESNYKDLHDYKMGRPVSEPLVAAFVKGLNPGHADSERAIARSVSVNARQDLVKSVLSEIKDFFRGLFRRGDGSIPGSQVQSGLQNKFMSTQETVTYKNYDQLVKGGLDGVFRRVGRTYELPEDIQPGNDRGRLLRACKRNVCNQVQREIKNQVDGLNPHRVLAQGSGLYMRQTSDSNASVVVGVINAVLQSGDAGALSRLRGMFSDEGCTLMDEKGEKVQYRYKNYLKGNDGCSPFERIVKKHVEDCNVRLSARGKTPWKPNAFGTVFSILGFKPFGWTPQFSHPQVGNARVRGVESQGMDFVAGLKRLQTKGRLAVCSSRGSILNPTGGDNVRRHYSLRLPNDDENGNIVREGGVRVGVRLHVVADRPDGPNGEFEFDHVFRFADLQRMFSDGRLEITSFRPRRSDETDFELEQEINLSGNKPKDAKVKPAGSKKRAQKRKNAKAEGGTLAFKIDKDKLLDAMRKRGETEYKRIKDSSTNEKELFQAREMEAFLPEIDEEDLVWLIKDYAARWVTKKWVDPNTEKGREWKNCKVAKNGNGGYSTNIEFNEDEFVKWASLWFAEVSLNDEGVGKDWHHEARELANQNANHGIADGPTE